MSNCWGAEGFNLDAVLSLVQVVVFTPLFMGSCMH